MPDYPWRSPLELLIAGSEPRQRSLIMEGGCSRFVEPPSPPNAQLNASAPYPPGTPGSASPQDFPVTRPGVDIREIYPLLRLLQNLSGPRPAY